MASRRSGHCTAGSMPGSPQATLLRQCRWAARCQGRCRIRSDKNFPNQFNGLRGSSMAEARSIASLTISFGLVAIPVKLYSATIAAERISFNMLHKKDGSRLKQQYVCATEGTVVDRSEIVKGYEFAKDQYVMFTSEEIKELEEAGSDEIGIGEFVPLESVDPVYFERTYLLSPDKGGSKPYTLLVTALRETKQCAVGRWASRGREHVVVIRPMDQGLAMHQLHFHAEVRSIRDLGIEDAKVSEAELKLARQ